MTSLSRSQIDSVASLLAQVEDIDPGIVMIANITVQDASESLIGDITWNAGTEAFEWVQA